MSELNLLDKTLAQRYRVISVLGEGAMGCVYLADDLQLHRQVAMKVLRQEWVRQPEVRRRLENECQIMARLGPHQHIVTLFDRLEYEGDIVLIMEYVPGETLADVLSRLNALNQAGEAARKTTPVLAGVSLIALQPKDAAYVAMQCLDALDFAHSRGILHRDIKPSNMMLMRDHNGQLVAKIMDFGIGKALADSVDGATTVSALTMAGAPGPGTPAYMAPEQIDPGRFGPIGPHSDLYALGATLFEMLTMRPPFQGTYTELLNAHTNVQPPDPSALNSIITSDLRRVVLKALAKHPQDRYTAASIFKNDLIAASAPGGTVVLGGQFQTPAAAPAAGTGAKLKVIGALAFCAVIVVCLAAAAVYVLTNLKESEKTAAAPAPSERIVEEAPTSTATPEPLVETPVQDPAAVTPAEDMNQPADSTAAQEVSPAANTEFEQAKAQVAMNAAGMEKSSKEVAYTGRENELSTFSEWTTGSSAFEQSTSLYEQGMYSEALGQAEQAQTLFAAIPNPAAAPITVSAEDTVQAVLDTWAGSVENHDIETHMACYGDTLSTYFTKKNVSNSAVRTDKTKFLGDYSSIDFTLSKMEIQIEGQEAVATFDKEWDAKEGERQNAGAEKQRLRLQSDGTTWKIVSEEEVEVYWTKVLPKKPAASAPKKPAASKPAKPKADEPIVLIPVGKPTAVKIN